MLFRSSVRARDTQRYLRAWQLAGNDVHDLDPVSGRLVGGRMSVAPVRKSKHFENIFPTLSNKARALKQYIAKVDRERMHEQAMPRPNRQRVRVAERTIAKAEKALERIEETLDAIDASGGAYKFGIRIGGKKTKSITALSSIDRAVIEVFGGRGRLVGERVVELVNLEPHARIVSRRTGIERETAAWMRSSGLRRCGAAFAAKMTAATGQAVRVAG